MKKTLFVALAATVALFATSCKPKGDAPKASFSYEVEDLTVTFTNISKDATTYAWEFGDGETSTEANPIHTYAENGSYTVTLTASNEFGQNSYSEEIILATAAIKIDGEFADWDAVIADKTAAYTALEDGVEYDVTSTSIKKFAAYLDADFFYFYMVCDADKDAVMPLDLYIGCEGERVDESPCTNDFDPIYMTYLLEFGKGDSFEADEANYDWWDWTYTTFFLFDHEAGGWTFEQITQNICTLSDKVVNGNLMSVEGKVARANFTKATAPYFYVGAITSNSGWGGSGIAPTPIMEDGAVTYQPQLKVEEAK